MAISNETAERVLGSLREEFIERVIPSHILDCLSDFLDQREEEEIRAKVREFGETNGAEHLWNSLSQKPDWFEHIVKALYHKHVDLPDLAEKFIKERGCLPVHINIRGISHQNGTILFQTPDDEESPMDIDDLVDEAVVQGEAKLYTPLKFDVDEPSSDQTKLRQEQAVPQVLEATEVQGSPLNNEDKRVLLDRFNVILQGAVNAEGRQIIEDTLRSLELQLIAVRNGSVILVFETKTHEALQNVYEMHRNGTFAKIIRQKLIRESVMRKLRKEAAEFGIELTDIHLTTLLRKMEFVSLKAWITSQEECIVVQSPLESFCLYGKDSKTHVLPKVRKEKIRQLKSLRRQLPISVRQMVEDPFIRDDFIDNAIDIIFGADYKEGIKHAKSADSPQIQGRRIYSEIMNWISTIYDDRLSRFNENLQEMLLTLALVTMGNVCVRDDETICIEEESGAFRVILEENVRDFLKEELILSSEHMHFDVPNALLVGLQMGVVHIPIDIDHLVAQDILFRLETRRNSYRFVSDLLRDFLIGASICYKTLPAVQRSVKTTLLQYFHKFKYIHIPVCNPLTCQAAQAHSQVVINVYKEIEKDSPSKADAFGDTLMCSLEFCMRPEAKGWFDYFGSKLKLVHSEGTFKRPGSILSQQTKQFVSTLVTNDILYKFMVCDADVSMSTKLTIKSKLDEFTKDGVFEGSGIFTDKTEDEIVAIIRSMQVLDLIKISGNIDITDDGKLICELEKKDINEMNEISLDLSTNALDSNLLQKLEVCFDTVSNVTSLSLVRVVYLNLKYLRRMFSRGCFSNLKVLDLSGAAGFENFNKELGINYCPDLEELHLAKCRVGDKGLEHICHEIGSLSKFKKLDISDNDITIHGIIILGRTLVGKCTFTSINLSGNNLGGQETGCGLVMSLFLQRVPLLEVLELQSTNLNYLDLTTVVHALPSTVKRLDIRGNDISEMDYKRLIEIPKQCPHLKIVVL